MRARHLTTILPAMTLTEAVEPTRNYRVTSLTGNRSAFVTTCSFRAPHRARLTRGVNRTLHYTGDSDGFSSVVQVEVRSGAALDILVERERYQFSRKGAER